MTDDEIIKALECCMKTEFITDCAKCEMLAFDCKDTLIENALNLINRQKAEIERLNIEFQSMRSAANSYKIHLETAKSEAIKEFAERLKEHRYGELNNCISFSIGYLDNLVKEITEVD
jgi:hypothetical protein